LLVAGTLDAASLDPRISGYALACKQYLQACRPPHDAWTEEPLYDIRGQFAGTPDMFGDGCLTDWKCSNDPATEIQLGGYCDLLCGAVRRCRAVELHEDGSYRVEEYQPKRSLGLWRAALSVWQWQEANGYHKETENDNV
jgi:hypothetical protein